MRRMPTTVTLPDQLSAEPRATGARRGLSMKDVAPKDTWTVFKIMGEFVEGFETLRKVEPAVSIFGGSRVRRGSRHYRKAVQVSQALAREGFSIITGGGPGIMEAANLGARRGGGLSIGLNIRLPFEHRPNRHIDTLVNFNYFFARKVMFIKYACAYVVFPGGYGTLDEAFEALTLVQTHKIDNFPVIMIGREYWKGLLRWIHSEMLRGGMITRDDLRLFTVSDDPQEVCDLVREGYRRRLRDRGERRAS
ncbi:MAG: TIGR00730 family Rossman fold protein [Candidatus Polarisedimenticolia bacterium]